MARGPSIAVVVLCVLAGVAWPMAARADAATAREYLAKARAEVEYASAAEMTEKRVTAIRDDKRLGILLALVETEAEDLIGPDRDSVLRELTDLRRELEAFRAETARRSFAIDLERRFDRLMELIGTKWAFDAEALAIAELLFTEQARRSLTAEDLGTFRARLATFQKTSDRLAKRVALDQLGPLCADLERRMDEVEPALRSLSDVARRPLLDKFVADVERLRTSLLAITDPNPAVPPLWQRYNALRSRLDRVVEHDRIARDVESLVTSIGELERRCAEATIGMRAGTALGPVGAELRLVETQVFTLRTRIERLPATDAAVPELMDRRRALERQHALASGLFAELTLAAEVAEAALVLRRELDEQDRTWAGRTHEVVGATWSDYRTSPTDDLRQFKAPVTIAYLDNLRRYLVEKRLALARIHPAVNAPAVRAQLERATASRDAARGKLVSFVTAFVAEMERTDLAKEDLATASQVVLDIRAALGADTEEAMALSWRVQKLIERACR